MKKQFFLAGMLLAWCGVFADGETVVKVTGDRVSLRAAPDLSAVLLTRTSLGEELSVRDNSNPDWVGVQPPERVDFWAHGEFVQDGTVIPALLNIRSGPSLNHTVVGVVRRGRALTVRGEVGGWVQIAPPEETVAWISRKYCDLAAESGPEDPVVEAPLPEPRSDVVIQVVPAPEPMPAVEVQDSMPVTEIAVQPEINDVMVTVAAALDGTQTLLPDPKKTQGADWSFVGLLKPAAGVLSKLVDPDTGQVLICYIRGNEAQMKECDGRRVSIFGRTYWAVGLDRPMVVPVTIQVLED